MAATFILLGSTELSSSQASLTFSSIPATYTDLRVYYSVRDTNTGNTGVGTCTLKFNSSSTNYTGILVNAYDGALAASIAASTTYIDTFCNGGGSEANTFAPIIVDIAGYSDTSYNKNLMIQNGVPNSAAVSYMGRHAHRWADNSAISTITLTAPSTYSFAQYSTAYLYGISNT